MTIFETDDTIRSEMTFPENFSSTSTKLCAARRKDHEIEMVGSAHHVHRKERFRAWDWILLWTRRTGLRFLYGYDGVEWCKARTPSCSGPLFHFAHFIHFIEADLPSLLPRSFSVTRPAKNTSGEDNHRAYLDTFPSELPIIRRSKNASRLLVQTDPQVRRGYCRSGGGQCKASYKTTGSSDWGNCAP